MKEFLVRLIMGILEKLPEWLRPKMEDGKGAGKLEKQLQDKIKKDGWK